MGAGTVAASGAGGSAPGKLLPAELEALANAQPDAIAEVRNLCRLASCEILHGLALSVMPLADAHMTAARLLNPAHAVMQQHH